jgi:NADH-quinone oxidoreductase subunit A
MSEYFGVFLLAAAVTGFLLVMLFLSSWLGPKNKTATKQLPFECGTVSVGNVKNQRFNVKFYLVAMLFILFDVEVIFMYPWAVQLEALGWNGFFAMMSFMGVLGFGLLYVWRRGILDWA